MVDTDHEQGAEAKKKMPIKKKKLLSTAMERTSEWICSLEIPVDLTINIGEASFSLNKLPLVSKCGYIKKLVSREDEADVSAIELSGIPGGSEGFDYAAKFCHSIDFPWSNENIGLLRCVAEFLEMTEDYASDNMVSKAETFLTEVALKSLSGAITVLHSCQTLLPIAEQVKLVSRCIDTIALLTCRDSVFASPMKTDSVQNDLLASNSRPITDYWWAEDLTVLKVDFFQRVLVAMMARGFRQLALGPILMLYAKKCLRGLDIYAKVKTNMEPREEHEKRVIVETIVSLLPREKNTLSVSFLSMLIRAAIHLDTTLSCRLALEKRMSEQLGQAVLDDLLIPSYSTAASTLFDIDTVQRIITSFLENEAELNEKHVSSSPGEIERVTKLMESYLAEIASDPNLSVPKFTAFASLVPEQMRVNEDGMYRAVDIYLKVHPTLKEAERKQVCTVMDCHKLSREACAHAAQNDRLPVQTVVQVLFYEQQRLHDAVDGGHNEFQATSAMNSPYPVKDEVSFLRRENYELKMELVKTKMKLKEIEKASATNLSTMPSPLNLGKPPLPRKSFISAVSEKIGRFLGTDAAPKVKSRPSKDRRHSIS